MGDPRQTLDWVTSGERRKAGSGYSRFVRVMRFVLPLMAVVLTAVIILWDEMGVHVKQAEQEKFIPEAEQARGELLNPRFDSVDTEGRPFTVTAARAVQDGNNPKIVNLEDPHAEIKIAADELIQGQARQGAYEQEAGRLFLSHAVSLHHNAGYKLESEELRVDLKTGAAFSDLPVHVTGPAGTIEALGLEAYNDRGVLIFQGPARLVLHDAGQLSLGGGQ